MTHGLWLKEADTAPKLQATLKNGTVAANLTGATVKVRMEELSTSKSILDATATITDAPNGLVEYQWAAADVDTPGAYRVEFFVTYAGGLIQRFPQRGYLEVVIAERIEAPV